MWRGIINRGFTAPDFAKYVASLGAAPSWATFCVLHNTGAPDLKTYLGYAKRNITDAQWLLNLEDFYKNKQRWAAGPHLFVTPGRILVFTPLSIPGVHSPSWNSRAWGIEMVGDYQAEPFDPGVRANTIAALAALHSWRGLDPETIRFHKEDPGTTHKDCPGKNVSKADIIAGVQAAIAAAHPGEHKPGAPA